MKLKCGVLAIVLVGILCMGGGLAIGKFTQPITVINSSESHSYSSANSYAISGTITVNSEGATGIAVINMNNLTNIIVTTISNDVTNVSTNNVHDVKTIKFYPVIETNSWR